MRDRYNKQLESLYTGVKDMGILCEKAMETAYHTVLSEKQSEETYKSLLQSVSLCEKEIEQKEREVENLCIRLLLHQQPVASDLRTVSSALKLISDIERIGNHAYDISELSKYIRICRNTCKIHLNEMFSITINFVKEAVNTFEENDIDKAMRVIESDDEIDSLFNKIKTDLIKMIKENIDPELCIDLLMTAKYLERVGDHAVNIAKWVIYSVTGACKE